MKLRNKKTGKIWHMPRLRQPTVQEDDISFFACIGEHGCSRGDLFSYKSLAELNEEWEDYEPAEPLIKDEKIRKAVRAWWKTIPDAITDKRVLYKKSQDLAVGVYTIYCGAIYPETLEVGKMYTITELCGEEE